MNQVPAKLVSRLPTKEGSKPIDLGAFDNFAKSAHSLAQIYCDLERAAKDIYPSCPIDHLEKAERLLGHYDNSGRERVRLCKLASQQFELEDAYDDNGEITRAVASKHVALLIGSFPNANPADPEVYAKMLIEEARMAASCVTTLEAACRKIRRSAKFLPTISEVLTIIKEQDEIWDKRWDAIHFTDDTAEELRTKLTAEKERRAQEAVQREKIKTACPFAVGDRVGHQKFGVGTVSAVDGNKCTVQFANHFEPKAVVSEFLDQLSFETGSTKETSQ